MSDKYEYVTYKVDNMTNLYEPLVQICKFFSIENPNEVVDDVYEKLQKRHLQLYTKCHTGFGAILENVLCIDSAKVGVEVSFKDCADPSSFTIYIYMAVLEEQSNTLRDMLNSYPGLTLDESREMTHIGMPRCIETAYKELVEVNRELSELTN